ncbi:FadR/GntR family transcriptional regulator [Micromonospora sp. CA-263727]|uniref:FadR/GntR family transcriptional regulator n=1 Tax=Micromonospora sp. CA-263727 TaxID=3239967 RepID=UPI003D93A854
MSKATRGAARATAPVLHDAVLAILGPEITSGEHAPGTALTLEQLQQRFGVSRTVMREAMRILESLRLVDSRRRVGLVVQPMRRWQVLDPRVIRWRLDGPGRADQLRTLTGLRVAVEPLAAADAARHADAADRERLLTLATRMRQLGEAGELDAFLRADVEFHALLLQACRNEMFTALTGVIAEVLAGRTEHGRIPPPGSVALDLHERVARRVAEGDVRGAEAAMRELVEEVRDAISGAAPDGVGAGSP